MNDLFVYLLGYIVPTDGRLWYEWVPFWIGVATVVFGIVVRLFVRVLTSRTPPVATAARVAEDLGEGVFFAVNLVLAHAILTNRPFATKVFEAAYGFYFFSAVLVVFVVLERLWRNWMR